MYDTTTTSLLSGTEELTGFSKHLRQVLVVSKSRVDEWVEEQKAIADASAAAHEASVQERQDYIESTVVELLALQQGVSGVVKEQDEASCNGLRQRREKLETAREALEKEYQELEENLSKDSQLLKGTTILRLVYNLFCFRYSRILLC